MGRFFVQQCFKLHSNFNGTVNYTMSYRRDLVIDYNKTLDTDFSIFQETHVNFSHLDSTREVGDGEVKISSGKTHNLGTLARAKRTAPPIE